MSSRLFLIAIIATVLTFFLISTDAKANKEGSRASRAILNKRKSGKSSSSGGDFSGTATWFVPSLHGGSTSACGPEEDDDAYIVALNAEQYGDMSSKSDYCGKSVRITHNGKSVEAVINDTCPECVYGDLDLTKPVFGELGDFDTGVLDITWEII